MFATFLTKFSSWFKGLKTWQKVFFVLIVFSFATAPFQSSKTNDQGSVATPTPDASTPTPGVFPSPVASNSGSNFTVSQENAISKALDYLDYSSFSESGLVDQLKYEGFSSADANFAVAHIDVDWLEQAALKAQEYLDYSSFSRKGLIDQLIYEGFTKNQAVYGVNQVGL
jgi:hypothetical protein